MAGSTLIYNIVQKEREEEKICEKFIFQIPIDAFFSKQFAKYITYAVRSFLRLRRHPGELILNWRVTFFEYLGVWTVDLFWLSVFFVVKYFSFFLSNQLIYFGVLSSLLLLLLILTKIESGGYTFLPRCCLLCVCFLCAVLAPFVMFAFSITRCFVHFKLNFRLKNARNFANYRKNIYLKRQY